MKQTLDTVWQRRGISWLWDEQAFTQVCRAPEVWSLRQLLRIDGNWPDDLPSNDGQTVVVAGLRASLDLLAPEAAETWLGDVVKPAILSFQDNFETERALVFWLPDCRDRIRVNPADDAVSWLCQTPHGRAIDFGRLLWGNANKYPREILLEDGAKPAGLFHLRIT